jgi:hypothetical protein
MQKPRARRFRFTTRNPRVLHLLCVTSLVALVLLTTAWIQTEATALEPTAMVFAMVFGWCVKRLNDIE